ncbi:hypothetical protein D3C71_1906880 [compost metagenome]
MRGQRLDGARLGQPGQAFQQHMPVGQQAQQHLAYDGALPQHCLRNGAFQFQNAVAVDDRHCFPPVAPTA